MQCHVNKSSSSVKPSYILILTPFYNDKTETLEIVSYLGALDNSRNWQMDSWFNTIFKWVLQSEKYLKFFVEKSIAK
jgi:hypothetical protein